MPDQQALNDLVAIAAYEPGWDGYDGVPPAVEMIAVARAVVMGCSSADPRYHATVEVGPCSDGSLLLEVQIGNREVTVLIEDTTENHS